VLVSAQTPDAEQRSRSASLLAPQHSVFACPALQFAITDAIEKAGAILRRIEGRGAK